MYFIAIVLPQQLDEEILHYKKWMYENWGCKVGSKSPAHITIVPPFWMAEEKEHQLIQDIQNISASTSSFTLSTNNFSAFKPKTLFVAVTHNEQLNNLKKIADNYFRTTDYNIKTENRPFHPHITIATRDLRKKDFLEAWTQLDNKIFMEEFQAAGLSLLKHNGRTWDIVYTAPFAKPV
jgi:2'-5' RNA ligase